VEQRLVEDPVLRQRYRFERTTDPDGGEVLRVEMWVDPGGGVTPHVHPTMEERFEVLSGQPRFLAGRRWRVAAPGETVVVPPGVRHAYRNGGDGVAHIVCEARPPQSLQQFLEEAATLNRSGKLTRQAIPKGPRGLLDAVTIAHRHREMVTLLFPPMPPPRVQRLVLPALARFAERRGYGNGVPTPPLSGT
jgi:quercetin dioxygenase-like cupin family protein